MWARAASMSWPPKLSWIVIGIPVSRQSERSAHTLILSIFMAAGLLPAFGYGYLNRNMCILSRHHTHGRNAMRTNIVIADELMQSAIEASAARSKREAVELGLRTLVRRKKQEEIRGLRGKLTWIGDLDQMRAD